MKRGMPRSGRGNPAPQHMARPIASGPLMTEHLHNLDLELELLKRKREMIEQQQQLMEDQRLSRQRPYDFDQPRYFEQGRYDPPESSSNRNFSHLYDPAESHDFIPLSSDRKRQVEYPWTEDLPPKRFSGPTRGNATKSFGSRLSPMLPASRTEPHQSSSSFQRGGIEIDTNRHPLPKHEPRPLMALSTRPPRRPPLNPRQLTPKQQIRKDFKPTKVSKPKSVAKNPPNQLDTRPLPERKNLVAQSSHLVKKGDQSMILHADREPSVQLTGRLELALGQILKEIKLKYSERSSHAHIFQQQNLQRLMKQMIRERIRSVMLGKLVGTGKEVLNAYRVVYPVETDEDIVTVALEAQTGSAQKKFAVELIETENPKKYFKINTEKLIDAKLREMFNKLIEIYADPIGKKGFEGNKDTDDKKDSDGKKDSDVKKEKDEDFTKDLTEEDIKECGQIDSDVKLKDFKFSLDQLNEMIQWRLPRVLKKFIPFIIKMVNIDQMFEATKAYVIMKTNAKATALARKADKLELSAQRTPVPAVSQPQSGGSGQQLTQIQGSAKFYYVKIFGRPFLPKKKVMQAFLNQFRPKSVKKHKAINNLLFVGFVDKENFDKILAENGTVVGISTLEIKVSEHRPNQSQYIPPTNDDDVQILDDFNKTINLDDTLNSELDEQITDLLTSIRQAEEEQEKESEENENVAINEIDDIDKHENETITESKIESKLQNELNDLTMDVEKPHEVNNVVSEGQNESDAVQKDIEKADEVSKIVSEGQNEPNEKQKDVKKADEVSKIVSEGQNEPKEKHKDVKKADEVSNIVSESQNEPNEIQKDVEKGDEVSNILSKGDMNILAEIQEETENHQKESENETKDQKESGKEPNDQNEPQNSAEKLNDNMNEELEKRDVVATLKSDKESGRSTPTRTSARLANSTPSTIRTRRASRLDQHN